MFSTILLWFFLHFSFLSFFCHSVVHSKLGYKSFLFGTFFQRFSDAVKHTKKTMWKKTKLSSYNYNTNAQMHELNPHFRNPFCVGVCPTGQPCVSGFVEGIRLCFLWVSCDGCFGIMGYRVHCCELSSPCAAVVRAWFTLPAVRLIPSGCWTRSTILFIIFMDSVSRRRRRVEGVGVGGLKI